MPKLKDLPQWFRDRDDALEIIRESDYQQNWEEINKPFVICINRREDPTAIVGISTEDKVIEFLREVIIDENAEVVFIWDSQARKYRNWEVVIKLA